MIAKADLVPYTYYQGQSRNTTLALWDGRIFHGLRVKFGAVYHEQLPHPDDEPRYDVFTPYQPLGE